MVSILMPIYNGVEFVEESVASILAQTSAEWELLIGINGYSSANSPVYQKVFAYLVSLKDSRIRLFNFLGVKGKSATLNKLVPECLYDYIALLDVDDIWLPRKLECQLPFCRQNYAIIGTQCVYFGELHIVPAIPTGDISSFDFLKVNPVINSSALIKKELAYWDPAWDGVEDYDLWLRLWRQCRKFYNCESILVKHRIHKTSAFNAKGNNNLVAGLRRKWQADAPL